MKYLITLNFIVVVSTFVGQTTLLFEDFNSGFPAGWQMIDNDGLTPFNDPAVNFITDAWVMNEDYDTLGVNDSILISTSWFESPAIADHYLILPALTLGSFGNYISFDCKSKDQSFPDDFQILYSNSSLGAFTSNPVILDSIGPSYWTNITVSLDSAGITGQTIYLAFRHNAYDKFILEIDNIKVYKESPLEILNENEIDFEFYPNPATDFITIKGFLKPTEYFITDINGALIQSGKTLGKVALKNIAKGFYYLTIKGRSPKKIIIK